MFGNIVYVYIYIYIYIYNCIYFSCGLGKRGSKPRPNQLRTTALDAIFFFSYLHVHKHSAEQLYLQQ